MDKRTTKQFEITLDLDETDISEEQEMQLKALAEEHNMNVEDYLAGRFRDYREKP